MTGSARHPGASRLRGKIAVHASIGNCVLCGCRIIYDAEYTRLPGLLGKVCLTCAADRPGSER